MVFSLFVHFSSLQGHKRGQGSLAPVLERISGSSADVPTINTDTPNTRRLLSSPGEWLKQVIVERNRSMIVTTICFVGHQSKHGGSGFCSVFQEKQSQKRIQSRASSSRSPG
jgi:hypothetical protein